MAIIESNGFAHVRITVTDIAASKAFYGDLFGWPVAVDQSGQVEDPGVRESPQQVYGGVIYQTPSGALFGLRPVAAAGDRFAAERTGLDHVSFAVASRDDLAHAAEAMDEAGIEHGEINDLTDFGIAILSVQDPDGINLELTAPL